MFIISSVIITKHRKNRKSLLKKRHKERIKRNLRKFTYQCQLIKKINETKSCYKINKKYTAIMSDTQPEVYNKVSIL